MVEASSPAPFFVSGGTVPLDAPSYVPREADRALLGALLAGRYCYVLTSRQMGKSSLSVRTMEALRREGVRTAFVDLTRVGGRNVTPEQWYAGLLGEIGRNLGDRASLLGHWKAHPELGPMQRFFGALREAVIAQPDGRLVVFIDEIDATRSLPFSTDEFFAGVRECFNRRVSDPAMERLAFCLLGVAIPSDLMNDAKLTPFNVGERIVLRDFSAAEALAFAPGLGENGRALIERIVYWTDGHPFLTQSVGRKVAEMGARTPAEVDRLVAGELFESRARETNINLADVGNRVLNSYDDPDAVSKYRSDVLSLYERILKGRRVADDESNRLIAILKLAGLVKVVDGTLRVRNRIYERVFGLDWVREHMPAQELRRQKRAFRLGALRAGLVSSGVLGVVGAFAVMTLMSERKAHHAELEATRERNKAVAERTRADDLRRVAQDEQAEAVRQRDRAERAGARATKSAEGLRQSLIVQKTLAQKASDAARAADVQRRIALLQRRNALLQKAFALNQRDLARRNADEAGRQRALAIRGQESLRDELYENAIETASLQWDRNDPGATAATLDTVADRKDKGWEWGYWRRLSNTSYVVRGAEGREASTFVPTEGKKLISYDDFSAHWFDPETGRTVRELWNVPERKGPGLMQSATYPSFSRNGRWAIRRDADGALVMQDVVEGTARPIDLPRRDFLTFTISDDGLRVSSFYRPRATSAGPSNPRLMVWDGRTGHPLPIRPPTGPFASSGPLTPDGRAFQLTYQDRERGRFGMAEYDYTTGEARRVYVLTVQSAPKTEDPPSTSYQVTRDGTVVVACGSRVGVFDSGGTDPRLVFDCHTENTLLSVSQDGRYLVTSKLRLGYRMPLPNETSAPDRLWDLRTGELVAELPFHGTPVGENRILLVHRRIDFAGIDWRGAFPYRDASMPVAPTSIRANGMDSLRVFADGTVSLSRIRFSRSGVFRLNSLSYAFYGPDGRLRARYPATGDLDENTHVILGNRWLTDWTGTGSLHVRSLSDLRIVRNLDDPNGTWPDVSRDGRLAASIDAQGLLRIWTEGSRTAAKLQTDLRSTKIDGKDDPVSCALSPDGTRVLGYDTTHGYRVWDVRTLRRLVVASTDTSGWRSARWSSTGRWILVNCNDSVVRLEPMSGSTTMLLSYSRSGSGEEVLSPDDRLIVNVVGEEEIEVRSTRTGRRLFSLSTRGEIHAARRTIRISSVAFSDDGRRLYVLFSDGLLRTYEGNF